MSDSPAVLSRVRDPKYVGWLPRDAADVGTGEAGSMERGTMMRMQVRINGDTRRIAEAVFKVFGSSAAIASASLVAERLHGASVGVVKDIEPLMIVAELQLPMERANVAALAIAAANAAIEDWRRKFDRNL
jgi:iron-sulfur cluster assembly enzyme ISCU, mitochondrial